MTPYRKTGLPPGTLLYHGEKHTEKVRLTLLEYNEQEFVEKDFHDVDECLTHIRPDMVKWINVDGIHDTAIIQRLGEKFNIHPLTLEDLVNTDQRPKFEDYDNYVISIMKMLYYDSEIRSEQLSIILLGNNTVISFQEIHGGDAFDLIRNRIRQGKGRVRRMGADYLSYCLVDAVVDCYFNILEKIGDHIEVLEDEVIDEPGRHTMTQLHRMKREMIFLRKAVWPMRELIGNMERSETELIKPSTDIYLRDLYDHTIRVIDSVETYRDLLSGMMDIYLSSVSNKMNEVMKVLTIITTIFVPVTFIAGVYGMNFKHNFPELESEYGYPIVMGVMLAIIFGLLIMFRRKRWI
ncbi:MAG: magnesium/cobalt transporter CorA [Bacteroidota bacterium]